MRKFKGRINRALTKVFWGIAKLPFNLIYLFFRWIFSTEKLTKNGYVIANITSGKEKYEHRMIAEQILGRRLRSWEVVHHINGKRSDNKVSNLCVMPRKDHDRYHTWYDWIYKTYRKRPRRDTQIRKLKEKYNGVLLEEVPTRKTGSGW